MKWKHKSWVTIWLILVCAALMVTGSYAAYTKVEYVKRVVASKNVQAETVLFSSNYMSLRGKSENTYPLRVIPVGTQNDASVTVTVCNFLQSDLTRVNEVDIPYTLEASLVDADGNSIDLSKEFSYQSGETEVKITGADLAAQITINGTAFSGGSFSSGTETLPGGVATSHSYKITIPKQYISILSEVGIQMHAVPENLDKQLMARLWFGAGSLELTQWQGRFEDLNGKMAEYDGFNYTIFGTMKQTLRLYWNPDRVTLGKWSRQELGIEEGKEPVSTEDGNMCYFDIPVGGEGMPTSYTLQFYRVGGIPQDETPEIVKGYVSWDKVDNTENAG